MEKAARGRPPFSLLSALRSGARRQGNAPVAQGLLEHRDRRSGIARLALADGNRGRVVGLQAATRTGALIQGVDERTAVGLVVHGAGSGSCRNLALDDDFDAAVLRL